MSKIKVDRALISVSKKIGLIDFCRFLRDNEVELFATQGSLNYLERNNIEVNPVSDLTGFKDLLEGKIKTLSPRLHASILSSKERLKKHKNLKIEKINLVIVNLYDIKKQSKIDIGGHALIRSAAKNYKKTVVLTKPSHYNEFIDEFKKNNTIKTKFSRKKAIEAFKYTSRYDKKISRNLE